MNIFKGRINRKQYLLGWLFYIPFILILLFFLYTTLSLLNYSFNLENSAYKKEIYLFFYLLSMLIMFYYQLNLVFKRTRDISWSIFPILGLLLIQVIISFINASNLISNGDIKAIENNLYDQTSLGSSKLQFYIFIYYLILIFYKGTPGENRFGPNPKDKSALEAIFNLKKKEKIITDLAKIEKESSKINSKNILIWIGVLSGLIALSSIIYYFIYLPTVTKTRELLALIMQIKFLSQAEEKEKSRSVL